MLKKFFILKKIISIIFLIIVFCFSDTVLGQTHDNLEIFYDLIDSSGVNVIHNLPSSDKNLKLNLNLGEAYSLFQNHLESIFYKNGYNVNSKDSNYNKIKINYVLDQALVNYGDIFRNGFLGSYMIPRRLEISGNYSIKNDSFIYKQFHYNYLDTVKVDNVKTLENNSYPFTKGDVPAEPFFSSLFEPLVAIGTAAIAVFLFFTIRSK
jgi:hypothetical protein